MANFDNPVNLSNTQNQVGKFVNQVRSVANQHNVWVAWEGHFGNTSSQILLTQSHDGGEMFSPSIDISNPMQFADRPELATVGDFVYVIYVQYEPRPNLFIRTSKTSGVTFGEPVLLDVCGEYGSTWEPNTQIAAENNNVYVVWCGLPSQHPDSDVFFKRSTNNATSFDPRIKLNNVPLHVFDPKIAVSGELVYVVWTQEGPGNDVFFVVSHDAGKTFTKPVNLSNDTYSHRPQIAVSGNNVYATWVSDDPLNTRDIFITVGRDGAKEFSNPTNLSKNPNDYISDFPRLAASGNYLMSCGKQDTIPQT